MYDLSYFNEDGYGSRLADVLINESYYNGVEYKEEDVKKLTKAEESAIINRLIKLMTKPKRKRNEKV
jgi:hypothetical protein